MKLRALLYNEMYKLFRQSRTWYALGSLFFIELIILASAYFQGKNILDILLENLQKSFYFEGTLLNGNLLVYLVLNTQWFHLPLILMIVVSGMWTTEYKDRTIQGTMLQPVKKWKFLLSKYIVAIGFTLLAVGFLALTSFSFSYWLFGKGDLIVYLDSLNFFPKAEAVHRLQMAFLSGGLSMVFFSVASLTLAVIFRDPFKTWIVSACFLILSNLLLKLDFGNHWMNEYFFVKLNDTWQSYFYTTIDWTLVQKNTLLQIGYIVLFSGAGLWIFQRKDIQ